MSLPWSSSCRVDRPVILRPGVAVENEHVSVVEFEFRVLGLGLHGRSALPPNGRWRLGFSGPECDRRGIQRLDRVDVVWRLRWRRKGDDPLPESVEPQEKLSVGAVTDRGTLPCCRRPMPFREAACAGGMPMALHARPQWRRPGRAAPRRAWRTCPVARDRQGRIEGTGR